MTLSTFLVLATDQALLCHRIAPNILHLCHTTSLPHTSTLRANLSHRLSYTRKCLVNGLSTYSFNLLRNAITDGPPACVYNTVFHCAPFCARSLPTASPTSQCPEVRISYVMWHSPPYLFTSTSAALMLMWILIACAIPPNAPSSAPSCQPFY